VSIVTPYNGARDAAADAPGAGAIARVRHAIAPMRATDRSSG
jgi:hypothetical protein